MKKESSLVQPKSHPELDAREKAVLVRIVAKFREWYASLSVRELSNNHPLIREINAFEGIFRAALL